jgi:hypothetical protein
VFSGSWTVEASDAVGTVDGDLDAVDVLASLLAQSLILIDESDPAEPSFRMLNTIRVFARSSWPTGARPTPRFPGLPVIWSVSSRRSGTPCRDLIIAR